MFDLEQETPAPTRAAVEVRKKRPGLPLEPLRVLQSLRRARWKWLACGVVCTLFSLAVAKMIPRTFSSETVLVWEPPTTGDVMAAGRELQTVIATVKLPQNIAVLRERLHLEGTLEAIARKLDVHTEKETNVLVIGASAKSAEESLALAEAATDVFLKIQTQNALKIAQEAHKVLENDLQQASVKLNNASADFEAFRMTHGVWDIEAERAAAIQESAAFRAEALRNSVFQRGQGVKRDIMGAALKAEPTQMVVSETESRESLRKASLLRAELATKRATLSPQHPIVLALEASLRALETRVADDVVSADRTIGLNQHRETLRAGVAMAEVERKVSEEQVVAYEALERRTAERLARLSSLEGRAMTLLTALRTAKNLVDDLQVKLAASALTMQHPRVGFRVVAPPSLPLLPAKSLRRPLAVALPLVLFGLAFGLASIRYVLRTRPSSAAEVAFWGSAPVVATSCWPTGNGRIADLLEDLEPYWSHARGTTSVFASAPCVQPAANELASQLATKKVPKRDDHDAPLEAVSLLDSPRARRLAKRSSRVLVIVEAGSLSLWQVIRLRDSLGGPSQLAFVVVGIGPDLAEVSTQVGDVEAYWSATLRAATAL